MATPPWLKGIGAAADDAVLLGTHAMKPKAEAAEKPDSLDSAAAGLGYVSTAVNMAGMAAFALPIMGVVGKGVGWLGKWLPGGSAVGGMMQKPAEFFHRESPFGLIRKDIVAAENAKIHAENLGKPHHQKQPVYNSLGGDLLNASFFAGSVIEAGQVGLSFLQKQKIRKVIQADLAADRRARNIGGGASPLAESDRHVLTEHVLRGAAVTAGLFLNWRQLRTGHFGWKNFVIPMAANFGVDMLMGEDKLLQAYMPFKQAQQSGQATQKDYAAFIFAVSREVNARGALAEPAAMKVAEYYVSKKASAASILNDMATGEFKKHLADAVAVIDTAGASAPRGGHAAALNGTIPKHYAKVGDGKFTGRLHKETQQPAVEHKL